MTRTAITKPVTTRTATLITHSLIALRLSPLTMMLLCGFALLALLATLFVVRAALAPVATSLIPKSEWRMPKLVASVPNRAISAKSDAQTLARPIFFKSRRPLPEQEQRVSKAPPPPPPAPPIVKLLAIVGSRADGRAFLLSKPFPDGNWHRVGEQVESWTIAEMQGAELTLTNGAHSIRLRLYPDVIR